MKSHRRVVLIAVAVGVSLLASVFAASPSNSKVNSARERSDEKAVSGTISAAPANGHRDIPKGQRTELTNTVSQPSMPNPARPLEPQTGGTFNIPSSVIAGGGGLSSSVSPNFSLTGTVGQPAAGTTSSNGQFSATGGFWQPEAPLSVVSISGTLRYNCSSSGTPGIPNATVTATGGAPASTNSDANGVYSLMNLAAGGSYTVTPSKTSTTGSAGVDTADVTALRRHVLGTVLLTGCRLMAADANGDTVIDTADIVPTRRFALGFATGLSGVGVWHFTPPNRSYVSVISDQLNQDYDAFVTGDVTGDLPPTSPQSESIANSNTFAQSQSPLGIVVNSVNLPSASVSTPTVTNFTLPVTTTNIDPALNLVAFQGDFTFDPTVVTFQSPAVTKSGLTAGAIWSVQANLCPPGTTCTPSLQTLRVIADSDGSIPLSGAGTLFNLNFVRVSTTVGATTPLTWSASPNEFRFVEGTNFTRVHPISTPPGSITIGAAPSASNGIVAGRITNAQGLGVSGAVVRLSGTQTRKTITDADGNYEFANVETSGFYSVTPSRANYIFSPSLRSFSQLAERTEAAFGASFTGDALNPIDTPEYFVRQQYVDILGREPDEGGFNYWTDQILSCGNDARCVSTRRRDLAAAFFIEAEFQRTGSFIYGLYRSGLGRRPAYTEFSVDRQQVIAGPNLDAMKQSLAESFVGRAEFVARYQSQNSAESFVDALLANVHVASGVDLASERTNLIARYNGGANQNQSRSFVLRAVIDTEAFRGAEYNSAFVLTEYFGYLHRDPDQGGFDYWLNVLNNRDVNNYRGMVCAFINSREYQGRFSSLITRTDAECGQ
ncbi:MAG TPA: DUF4214 domain-containing protein [Pyrinomonadaceae bacterium]